MRVTREARLSGGQLCVAAVSTSLGTVNGVGCNGDGIACGCASGKRKGLCLYAEKPEGLPPCFPTVYVFVCVHLRVEARG